MRRRAAEGKGAAQEKGWGQRRGGAAQREGMSGGDRVVTKRVEKEWRRRGRNEEEGGGVEES